jgi:hypothetical protein
MRPALFLPFLLASCTATKASVQVVSAEEALHRAQEYDADTKAVYEFTMAEEYLSKARDELGHSQFRLADGLARQSAEWSDRAIIYVERRGKAEITTEGLSDTRPPPPPPPPPPPEPQPIDPELEEILAPATPAPATPAPDDPDDDDIEIPE